MNRRSVFVVVLGFITGLGTLFGSGAFSQTKADRSVTVEVAKDSAALLKLTPVNTNYAELTGDTLQININSNSGVSGDGVSYDAVTTINSVFSIANWGNKPVSVHVELSPSDTSGAELDANRFKNDLNSDGSYDAVINFINEDNSDTTIIGPTSSGIVSLSPGDPAQTIGIEVDLTGVTATTDQTLLDEIRVVATD